MLDTVTKGYLTLHPASAARTLARIDSRAAAAAFDAMPRPLAGQVLGHMVPASAARCLELLPGGVAGEILARVDLPAAVATLRLMDDRQARGLLRQLPRPRAARIRLRLRFSEWVVGAFVAEDVLTLSPDHQVGDALRLLRSGGHRTGNTIAVVDGRRKLVGVVDLLELLNHSDRRVIRHLMQPPVHVLYVRTALQTVVDHPAWTTHDSLPVVNRDGVFQGVLRRSKVIAAGAEAPDTAVEGNENMTTRAALADIFWLAIGALFVVPGRRDDRGPGERE